MKGDVDWIKTRIIEAQKGHESVTEAATGRVAKLLSSELSERPLSSTKLANIAKQLIEDMTPASSKTEAAK